MREVARGMMSLFDQTERKRDTHATKTPDLASSRPPDEFHVCRMKNNSRNSLSYMEDALLENVVKLVVVVGWWWC